MSIKNVVIGIAIVILTISVAVYGVSMIYNSPEYEDFCDEARYIEEIDTPEQCEAIEGKWDFFEGPKPIEGRDGYCDRDYLCREEYEKASEKYAKIVFVIAIPLGILVIILGAVVFGLEAVGAGLMGGGVGIILYGVGGFWRFAEDWLKFLLSLAGLIILIWFAHWFNDRITKQSKKKKK